MTWHREQKNHCHVKISAEWSSQLASNKPDQIRQITPSEHLVPFENHWREILFITHNSNMPFWTPGVCGRYWLIDYDLIKSATCMATPLTTGKKYQFVLKWGVYTMHVYNYERFPTCWYKTPYFYEGFVKTKPYREMKMAPPKCSVRYIFQ